MSALESLTKAGHSSSFLTGNLLHRWDKQKLRKEIFQYDNLDRLTSAQVHISNPNIQ